MYADAKNSIRPAVADPDGKSIETLFSWAFFWPNPHRTDVRRFLDTAGGQKKFIFFKKRLAFFEIHGIINRLDDSACWSSGQDDALSRRKPGFDSRTGHTGALSEMIKLLFLLWTLVCWAHWSFSLIRKMEIGETINHPLCGCASIVIQKNYLSVYNKVVQAILQKGKVIYGEERTCTRTYKMDVQISYD